MVPAARDKQVCPPVTGKFASHQNSGCTAMAWPVWDGADLALASAAGLSVTFVRCSNSAAGSLPNHYVLRAYSMLWNIGSGAEIGLPGRILAGLPPGKH